MKSGMIDSARRFWAGTAALAISWVCSSFPALPVWGMVAIVFISYSLILVFMPRLQSEHEKLRAETVAVVEETAEKKPNVLDDLAIKSGRFKDLAHALGSDPITQDIKQISDYLDKIQKIVEQDYTLASALGASFGRQLDRALQVGQMYARHLTVAHSHQEKRLLNRVGVLSEVRLYIGQQYDALVAKNLTEFEIAAESLSRTLQNDLH